jgi:hypothetical protein
MAARGPRLPVLDDWLVSLFAPDRDQDVGHEILQGD